MGQSCLSLVLVAMLASSLAAQKHSRSLPLSSAAMTNIKGVTAQQNSPNDRQTLQQQDNTDARTGFAAAPSCRAAPTAASSTPDSTGKLWGQLDGGSSQCAFKNGAGVALFYQGYQPGDWLHTKACSVPAFSDNSVMDSKLRAWAWEADGSLCAYKDDQQMPIPAGTTYVMLSWPETPACVEQPQPTPANAVADRFGCLCGWQLDRNCAFKSADSEAPVYYQGYTRVCDTAGSVKRAAEFNAKGSSNTPGGGSPDGSQKAPLRTPPVVTGFGCIGQRNAPHCTNTTVPIDFGKKAA